jgi:hypothetical protein
MSSGFDTASRVTKFYAAIARVKQLVADFQANEKFYAKAWRPNGDIATAQSSSSIKAVNGNKLNNIQRADKIAPTTHE